MLRKITRVVSLSLSKTDYLNFKWTSINSV
jgi:hypothetical protein